MEKKKIFTVGNAVYGFSWAGGRSTWVESNPFSDPICTTGHGFLVRETFTIRNLRSFRGCRRNAFRRCSTGVITCNTNKKRGERSKKQYCLYRSNPIIQGVIPWPYEQTHIIEHSFICCICCIFDNNWWLGRIVHRSWGLIIGTQRNQSQLWAWIMGLGRLGAIALYSVPVHCLWLQEESRLVFCPICWIHRSIIALKSLMWN